MWNCLLRYRSGFFLSICGAITAFGFAPFNLFFIPYLTFAFLFLHWLNQSPRQAFFSGYLFGLGFFGVGVAWLYISINLFGGINIIGAVLLTALLVLFLSLYPALAGYVSQTLRPANKLISLLIIMPVVWTLTEWLRSWIFTGFPWLTLGYSQIETPITSYATIGGVFFLSLLTAFIAACIVLVCTQKPKQKIMAVVFSLTLFVIGSGLQQHNWTEVNNDSVEVALIQAAIPQKIKWRREYRAASLERYLALSQAHWGKDIIIWPETAIPAYYHDITAFIDELEQIAQAHGTTILTGIPIKNINTGDYYNSVIALGEERQQYHKRHLVPFGEYVPLGFIFNKIIKAMQIPMSDFSSGNRSQQPLLQANDITLGMSICYEDIFGNEIIQALPEAELLINVSNDAWFGNSAAPHQHLQMARMRSVETGRYLIRATNTGISAIINEKGKIISRSKQFEPDSNSATVKTHTGHTPYSRWGDSPLLILLFLTLILLTINRQSKRKTTDLSR